MSSSISNTLMFNCTDADFELLSEDKVRCLFCNKSVKRLGYKKHTSSKRHIKNINLKACDMFELNDKSDIRRNVNQIYINDISNIIMKYLDNKYDKIIINEHTTYEILTYGTLLEQVLIDNGLLVTNYNFNYTDDGRSILNVNYEV
jgi:hypothetical protein